MPSRYICFVLIALLYSLVDAHDLDPQEGVRILLKGKPKSKPKSKPKPEDKFVRNGEGVSIFCAERFNRTDTTLVFPVICGENDICMPTAESILDAAGSYDIALALQSTKSLDIRCVKRPTGTEYTCDPKHSNGNCADDSWCIAFKTPLCTMECQYNCFGVALQDHSSDDLIHSSGDDRPLVSTGSLVASFVMAACIGAGAVAFLGWRRNKAQFEVIPVQSVSGHELVQIYEADSF